jgi:hypothetical protein
LNSNHGSPTHVTQAEEKTGITISQSAAQQSKEKANFERLHLRARTTIQFDLITAICIPSFYLYPLLSLLDFLHNLALFQRAVHVAERGRTTKERFDGRA